MHKDKCLLPISLTVTKISGIGEDTLCMGVIQARGGSACVLHA
jgi:hypothetical protein